MLVFLFFGGVLPAQLKSPADFLGYELGQHFTPHYKIMNYFYHAAAVVPTKMKLERYGFTNEGRELLIAVIASPENFSHLEEIRKNNLRLTGLLDDRPGDINAPAIVWLSYNVHGNEPSSSEVSMKVLYALLDPENMQAKEWLKNTVVIIDPCLNPDGRDRYVNWFNQMVGSNPNANPDSREHNEPWPGGRTNHYNFDLNRDWAWQTQLETQQRIKKYNEWMPHIHCDFHEQYPNNPYYFAPAAEPFHEAVTAWQREFQTTIGKNHAKYFDAKGWLYFTREIFDLFYPAYGDTYPTFNGAIGMTYEQAGHSPGGLAVAKTDGDTLRLKDRIEHHFTTSMSTIEITSRNSSRVVREFQQFFSKSATGNIGEYRSFIVSSQSAEKLAPLKKLLNNNNILFGAYNKQPGKGYNYFTGKEENIETEKYSILINTNQPKATLVKVLFEPRTKLSDSATYDITAWSLPYVYGLKTYALKEELKWSGNDTPQSHTSFPAGDHYAYLMEYNSFVAAQVLARLLRNNIRVYVSEKGFETENGKYSRGTMIILKKGNEEKLGLFQQIVSEFDIEVRSVSSGFVDKGFDFGSEKTHFIKRPNVALLTGSGTDASAAGEIWHLFEQQLNYPINLINATDVSGMNWKNVDVLIMPSGNYKFLGDKEVAADLKTWVRQGGKIIALESAAAQMAAGDWGIKLKKGEEDKKDSSSYANVKKYEDREKDGIANNVPGAIYKVQLDNSHPLSFGYPDYYFSLKQNDNIYEFAASGWNVGIIRKDMQVSGFVGSKAKERLRDGTVIGVTTMGNGSVIFFADDPVFRSFWENGKLILANAVFLVGQ